MDLNGQVEALLPLVRKPARYLGSEWNVIKKEHSSVAVRMALAFPDLYEVGMSNLGQKILYHVVNSRPEMLCERIFAPAADMENLMRRRGLPLFALESRRPAREFDLLGFSLQYELSYTNVLNMLDLAGIPLYASLRGGGDPLVIGGGPCAFNPEPLAPFFDLFLLGDGEEGLPELLEKWVLLKRSGAGRKEILAGLASIRGVYVPSFYKPVYSGGLFRGIELLEPAAPELVRKNVLQDLDRAPYPLSPVVPYVQSVHDRAVIELFRGCGRGCRFCQAGVIYRPVRRRSRETLRRIARETLRSTGYEELSLASLSSSDYPSIELLVGELAGDSGGHVQYSLPSLRLDSFSVKLAGSVHRGGRRGSLTFAPEAGTARLRRVIGKDIDENHLYTAVGDAVREGWQSFKLYFMIGLPTETDEDVNGIAALCRSLVEHVRREYRKGIRLSVSISTFVPKAHTPFQWEPMLTIEEVGLRQRLLKEALRKSRSVVLSWHEAGASFLEAVFARGDRRLAPVLEAAWRRGCRFDGWREHFLPERWQESFAALGIDPAGYAYRRINLDEPLPWDHLAGGISKEALLSDYRRSGAANQSEGDHQ